MGSKLVRHVKVIEDNGNIVEVKMWRVTPTVDKPNGYKYSLVYIVNNKRIIGYDNGEGKGDHKHYRMRIEQYQFKDLKTLTEDFYRDIKKYKEGKL